MRELYRVEQISGERVLVEDCRSGDLYDMRADQLTGLRVIRSGPSDVAGSPQQR